MTTDELFEKLDNEFAERLAEEFAQRERRKTPGIGLGSPLRDTAAKTAVTALRKAVRYNRGYAIETDENAMMEFAALALAARKQNVPLTDVMATLAKEIPNWIQERPTDEEGVLPPLPVDPLGQRIRNPWLPLPPKAGEKHPRFDTASQNLIREASPRLAKYLEDCVANGGEPSASMIADLASEKARADKLRKLPYDVAEWNKNVLRSDIDASLIEKSEFARAVGDDDLLEFHRREAKLGPPSAQFNNLGTRMQLARENPKVREVHKAAEALVKQWATEGKKQAA